MACSPCAPAAALKPWPQQSSPLSSEESYSRFHCRVYSIQKRASRSGCPLPGWPLPPLALLAALLALPLLAVPAGLLRAPAVAPAWRALLLALPPAAGPCLPLLRVLLLPAPTLCARRPLGAWRGAAWAAAAAAHMKRWRSCSSATAARCRSRCSISAW